MFHALHLLPLMHNAYAGVDYIVHGATSGSCSPPALITLCLCTSSGPPQAHTPLQNAQASTGVPPMVMREGARSPETRVRCAQNCARAASNCALPEQTQTHTESMNGRGG